MTTPANLRFKDADGFYVEPCRHPEARMGFCVRAPECPSAPCGWRRAQELNEERP